jgi:hypothetical protein
MKKFILFVLALSVCALAAEFDDRVDGLQEQIDRVMSKAGIHFNGEFRSQYLSSTVDGDAVGDGKKSEGVMWTNVDFDIMARPNTALSARAIFRLHQDWRIFFSDVQNPIATRWLSIDGSLLDGVIKYNFGDYRKKLTPLTLWSPDLEFMFEPEIFAESRKFAMSEAFVGGNLRSLQGVNVQFAAEVLAPGGSSTILHELFLDLFAARLSARGTGESDVVAPGVVVAGGGSYDGGYWDRSHDKYLVGANLASQIVEGAGFGISNVLIFDHSDSYTSARGPNNTNLSNLPDSIAAKLSSEWTNVFAGRINLDNRAFMDDGFIYAGIRAEAAMSMDKGYRLELDGDGNTIDTALVDSTFDGMALNAGFDARIELTEGSNVIKLSVDYIHNDTAFRNDAAQSPSFLQRAILNNENPLEGLGVMNPFDALYRSVFKYAPSQYFGGPKPHTKNAYTNSILNRDQVSILSQAVNQGNSQAAYVFPSVFQAALPGGMATADRSGLVGSLNGSFLDEGISVGAKAAMLQSYKAYNDFKRKYEEIVGGASVNIAKFAPAVGPSLVIGGSVGIYNQKLAEEYAFNSNLISLGLSYNFVPRFSVLAGYQMLNTKEPETMATHKDTDGDHDYKSKYDYDFVNMAFGVSYKVADGGALTFKLTMLTGEKKYTGDMTYQWVDVNDGTTQTRDLPVKSTKYTSLQPEVYLTVKF